MKIDYLKNGDGTTSVFVEKAERRGETWSGVVAELKPVDGGVIITQGVSKEPVACRPNMIEAAAYAKGMA